ncbi:MAG: ATP-binding cassette domain-containing protein, partial [Clostridium butyricum]
MYYEADKKVEKPIITLRGIIQTYKSQEGIVTALQNINFDINEGEFICVLGQSGCGKSTMLKLIAGFLKP